ncbi:MAG: DsbA family oxidoreductase [Saprospiraceae bacterium]|nr:DsbA family oxidoreductase [Saprospiraceae bacterium]
MKVEIWSDIMCPFCYIGKRHFEEALNRFDAKDRIEIEWKSYQLDPEIPEEISKRKTVYQYLSERKGISPEQSEQLHQHVIKMARQVGLEYRFDLAVVANSLKAHRIIQRAKELGLGDRAEEVFFKAYFTQGRDLNDAETLEDLGILIGLNKSQIDEALTDDVYAYKVYQDIQEGSRIGVRGVPFFVFDRKYGISGAQPIEVFIETLEKSFSEREEELRGKTEMAQDGDVCSVDGQCE